MNLAAAPFGWTVRISFGVLEREVVHESYDLCRDRSQAKGGCPDCRTAAGGNSPVGTDSNLDRQRVGAHPTLSKTKLKAWALVVCRMSWTVELKLQLPVLVPTVTTQLESVCVSVWTLESRMTPKLPEASCPHPRIWVLQSSTGSAYWTMLPEESSRTALK